MDQSMKHSGTSTRGARRTGRHSLIAVLMGLCLQLILSLQALAQEAGSYLIHTVGGGREGTLSLPSGQGLPALATYFQAFDLTLDPIGNLFFADRFSRIFKVDRSGVISLAAGGFFGYGGDGGPALAALLNQPASVASDRNGILYLADRGNQRIRRISSAGTITTFAGTGSSGTSGDGGPALSALFDKPGTIAIDASGNLYVSDITGSIRKVNSSGIITTIVQESGEALTVHPSGALYFVKDNQVRKLASDGTVSVAAGAGQAGFDGDGGPAVDALLNRPTDLAFDQAGNLYIADSLNRRVRKVTSDGIIRTIAGTGVKGHSGDGGPALTADLGDPYGVVVDSTGSILVTMTPGDVDDPSGYRIRILTPTGPRPTIPPLSIATPSTLPSGQAAKPYWTFLTAEGGLPYVYYWSLIGGTLPQGLELSVSTGVISGTPGQAGTFQFTVQATDRQQTTASRVITLAIDPPVPPKTTLQITTPSPLPRARVGHFYSVTLAAGGAPPPYAWSIPIGSSLPFGLTLNPVTGVLSGTPTDAGSVPFTVRASYNSEIDTDKNFEIAIDPPALTVPFLAQLPYRLTGLDYDFLATQSAGMVFDGAGNLYLSDPSGHRIVRISPTGVVSAVAGIGIAGFTGDGGPALQARFQRPAGLAMDAFGSLFVADLDNHRIRKVSPAGIVTTVAGTGTAGFAGDGGPAESAQLNYPRAVVVDVSGNLYIADTLNQRVRKVGLDGRITVFVGDGTASYGGDGGPATSAQLNSPQSIAMDVGGNLYIADFNNNRIRKVANNGMITTFAGTGLPGYSGDAGPAIAAQFRYPTAVAIDRNGNLLILDSQNFCIRKVDSSGSISTLVQIPGGDSIAVDSNGNLAIGGIWFLPSTFPTQPNITIPTAAILPTGRVEEAYSVTLSAEGSVPFAYRWTITQGSMPDGLVLDGSIGLISGTPGRSGVFMFTAQARDFNEVRISKTFTLTIQASQVSGSLLIEAVAGSRARGMFAANYTGEGRSLWSSLNWPRGMATDSAGNLFIADGANHRVRRVTPAGIITTVAGTGLSGSFGDCASSGPRGDGGQAVAAQLCTPADVALDASGNLYITEMVGQRVRKVTPAGLISTLAGNGKRAFAGDGGPGAQASLHEPMGLAVDNSGNVYIADSRNHRIRKVSPDGRIETIAGSGSVDTFDFKGLPHYGGGYGGDGGPATQAQMRNPQDVAIDPQGNLYIVEWGNQRIRRVSAAGTIDTFAGNGARGFGGDGGPALAATLNYPQSVAVDGSGNIYLADSDNHRVRRVDPSGKILTIAGFGSAGFSGNGLPAVAAQLNSPQGIAVDQAGNLWIADTYNHQVRRVFRGDPSQPPTTPPKIWILPSSARSRGLNGAFFTTELLLANTGSQSASMTLEFLGNNRDGRNGISKTLTLAAGTSLSYPDVLASVFGVADGFGAIRVISSSSAVVVQGQTATPSTGGGSYGHSVPAVWYSDWIAQGLPRTIVAIREDGQFRTNLILTNATEDPLEVQLELRTQEGIELARKELVLRPLEMTQLTRLVRSLGVEQDLAGGQLVVSTPTLGGYLAAYAVSIDNSTNDPRSLLPEPGVTGASGTWLLPSIARAPGLGGAYYTSDVTLANTGIGEATAKLKFLGNHINGRHGPEKTFVIAQGTSVTFSDVLHSLFSLEQDFGAIQVSAALRPPEYTSTGTLTVQAQTSTPGSGRTFGQNVPAAGDGQFIDALSPRSITGIREDASFRSNLILANARETQTEADLSVISQDGVLLASRHLTLQPLGMVQLTRVVRELGIPSDISGARILLSTPIGSGAFAAYVALIDNLTNDPRTLLPQ